MDVSSQINLEPKILEETVNPTVLKKLNIAIHPLFMPEPIQRGETLAHAARAARIYNNTLDKMTPRADDEATYIMPFVLESQRFDFLDRKFKQMRDNPQYHQLTDLYKDMVKENGGGKNIIMGTNIVPAGDDPEIPAEALLDLLKIRGFEIDENTEIVVGGEMLNYCVRQGILKLMESNKINKISVDFDCTADADFLHETGEEQYAKFVKSFGNYSGIIAVHEGNTCTLTKNNLQVVIDYK